MKALVGSDLKEYFKDPTKVTSWWRPEEGRFRFWHLQEFKVLDAYVKTRENMNVLDAACGQGRFARYYAKRGCRVQALDINREMLRIARERAEAADLAGRISFHEGDVETFAGDPGQFDLVSCMHALEHMADLKQAIKNLAHHLKQGGCFVTTYTSTESPYGRLRRLYTFLASKRGTGDVDIARTYTFDQVQEALTQAGLRIDHLAGIGLLTGPQERVRLPVPLNKCYEWTARADVFLKPYYRNGWLAKHCSLVVIVGTRL